MSASTLEGRQRLQFFDGQLLGARDLRDDVAYDNRMRSLHVVAMHGVWGIALGYDVLIVGQVRVLVEQGLAYDCRGREIVLSSTLDVDLPPAPRDSAASAWWFDLLIRYDDHDRPKAERGDANCHCSGAGPGNNAPALRWSFAGDAPTAFVEVRGFAADVRLGEEIPLARFRMTDARRITDVDRSVRHVARGQVRPQVAGGRVGQGLVPVTGSPLDWTAWIDTSAGGFNAASPFYFASLADHPWLSPASGFAALLGGPGTPPPSILGPFVGIEHASASGFALHVRMAAANETALSQLPEGASRQSGLSLPVAVDWVGIQPDPSRGPSFDLSRIVAWRAADASLTSKHQR
jgi:hypothetical protein